MLRIWVFGDKAPRLGRPNLQLPNENVFVAGEAGWAMFRLRPKILRFLPGLRVAIPVACAYARVKPIRFSTLNLMSAFAWASAIMLLVARLGPDTLAVVGVSGGVNSALALAVAGRASRQLARLLTEFLKILPAAE